MCSTECDHKALIIRGVPGLLGTVALWEKMCLLLFIHYKNQVNVFESKVLRKVFGPTKERDGTWRIKTMNWMN